MLLRSLEMIESYPLLAQLYLENTMEILVRKLPDNRMEEHFNRDHAHFLPLINMWQSQGILKEAKSETITSLIRAVLLLSLQKQEIGEPVYRDTMALLIDLVSDGLSVKGNEKDE